MLANQWRFWWQLMPSLFEQVPDPNDLLALEVEDLAEVVFRAIPRFSNHQAELVMAEL